MGRGPAFNQIPDISINPKSQVPKPKQNSKSQIQNSGMKLLVISDVGVCRLLGIWNPGFGFRSPEF
jgi:hypothetical protein